MADSSKTGTDWTDEELDLIVTDYFAMLAEEIAGRPYVKAHHREALVKLIHRSHQSVEFKHRNISAVLEDLGLPWIIGYKPARNFQHALFGAIERQLTGNRDGLYSQAPAKLLHVAEPQAVFVPMPEASDQFHRPGELERLARKFDPAERDFRNRQLGTSGEEFVFDIERRRLSALDRSDLARKVRWTAKEDGDGAGYDIMSFEPDGSERLIEVKTTTGAAKTPFFLTRNEVEVSSEHSNVWHLYRVHQFSQKPRIFTVRPPLELALRMDPETWRAKIA